MDNEFNNTVAVVGMILAIMSIVFCWIPVLGLVLGIVGLILGIVGLKKSKLIKDKGKGFGIAGISCGSVGIVFSVIYTIMWIFIAILAKESMDYVSNELDYDDYYYNYTYNTYNTRTYRNSILNDYNF